MARRRQVPRWVLFALPLIWLVPALTVATGVTVPYIEGPEGDIVAWAAGIVLAGPSVIATVLAAAFGPLGWRTWLWLGVNILLGFVAMLFIALVYLAT